MYFFKEVNSLVSGVFGGREIGEGSVIYVAG